MVENIYKFAVENKIRFPFKGLISVEDLFDLNLESLDSIYKSLNSQKKKANEESLLATKSSEDEALEVSIEIVKQIFAQKQKEKEDRIKAAENRAKKQRIAEIINNKKDEALNNLSVEQLQQMLDGME